MSIQKNKDELKLHQDNAIKKLSQHMESLIESTNEKERGKADKMCYWLEDWITFLKFESSFNPKSLRRYKRGEIIKVHLGFNVGSEEGGLHYAVVLDKENAKTSPVVTIVPLTSVKPNTDLSKLHSGSIFLGNDLYSQLNLKIKTSNESLNQELKSIQEMLLKISDQEKSMTSKDIAKDMEQRINEIKQKVNLLNGMKKEIQRLKQGSIALVNQITTISKIRIYDPKTDHDVLSGIKLSNEKLDMIDAEIIKKFTHG